MVALAAVFTLSDKCGGVMGEKMRVRVGVGSDQTMSDRYLTQVTQW